MSRRTGSTTIGGIYNASTPVLTDEQTTALQLDSAGNVMVNVAVGGGGGGGPATIADGADVTQGAIADAAITSDSNGTVSAKLRGLVKILADIWDSVNHRIRVDGSGVTQPISAASLPLPANAAKETGGNLATLATNVPPQGQALAAASMPVVLPAAQITTLTPPTTITVQQSAGTNLHVDVDNFPTTQPVSAASLPLPANAAQESGGNLATIASNTSGLALDSSVTALLVSDRRLQYMRQVQQAEFWNAQAPAGFVPVTEVPNFLGGY